MPFVTMCPYCRVGGIRVPDHAVGATATCPACKTNYTVFREERLPDRSGKAVTETAAMAAADDVTEPSPILTAERPALRPTEAPAPAAAAAPGDPALVAGLVGLVLFGLGAVATLLPFGRAVGLGLCVLGGVAGLAALGGEAKARLAGWAAAGLNAVAALVLLFAPGLLGLPPWRGPDDDYDPDLAGPGVVAHGGGGTTNLAGAIPAERGSWAHADLRVTVRPVAVGPVELVGPEGAKKRTRESALVVTVRLTNTGARRVIPLSGWAAGEPTGLKLTDPTGRPLARKAFDPGWRPAEATRAAALAPGNPADVVFAFEPPARADSLRLELAGDAVGEPGAITFQLTGPFGPRRGR